MADDEYNKKLESLQQYIPFLNNMIAQLKDPRKKNREQQLAKMVSLHSMITDKKKKLKLETLIKCEDVILKLYDKVKSGTNSQLGPRPSPSAGPSLPSLKSSTHLSPITPSSPSPPRDIPKTLPVVIPTEKVSDKLERDSKMCPPSSSYKNRIDIYSSAADSLKSSTYQKPSVFERLGRKAPDMSKPPISMEDLEALQRDVITERMSLNELTDLREKLQKQLKSSEDVGSRSPPIDTTKRNSTILTKKAVDKAVTETKSKSVEVKATTKPSTVPSKPVKVIKEASSIFGSTLSSIDNQILEGAEKSKSKEKERRSSTGTKKDSDGEKKEKKSSKDDKKESSSSHRSSKDKDRAEKKSKDKKDDGKDRKDDKKRSDDRKKHESSKKEHREDKDKKKEVRKEEKKDDAKKEEKKKDDVKKDEKKKDDKDDDKPKGEAPVYKRLADKYNPKPRKPSIEVSTPDVSKKVSESIETSMKTSPAIPFLESPVKSPVKTQAPVPLLSLSIPPLLSPTNSSTSTDNEIAAFNRKPLLPSPQSGGPAPVPPPVGHNIPIQNQVNNILSNPNATALINTMVNQFKGRQTPLLSPGTPNAFAPQPSPTPLFPQTTPNFHAPGPSPPNFHAPGPSPQNFHAQRPALIQPNFHHQNQFQPNFHPPNQNFQQRPNQPNFHPPNEIGNNRFAPPHQPNFWNQQQNFPQRPFTPQFDNQMQKMDFYPPGGTPTHNNYNQNPGLVSPQYDNFESHGRKANDEREGRYRDDWRRPSASPSPHKSRDGYRDPRLHRDNRERDGRGYREDPRTTPRRDSREHERDRGRFRDPRLNRGRAEQSRDEPRGSRSRSVSRDSDESSSTGTFASPLDSLYAGDSYRKTGKGYGVQNFKIPKVKKEECAEGEKVPKEEVKTVEEEKDEVTSVPEEEKEEATVVPEEKKEEVEEVKVVEEKPEEEAETKSETEETVASTSVSSSTECESKPPDQSSLEVSKDTVEVGEISSTNDIQESQTREEPKLDDPSQTEIINKFLKKLLENERTRAAASLFIDNVSSSLDDEKLKMVVQTVKTASVDEQRPKKRLIAKKKLVAKTKLSAKLVAKKKQLVKRKMLLKKRKQTPVIKDDEEEEKEEEEEEKKDEPEEEVVVSVGERIKSRKRAAATSTPKKRVRHKTELDLLHEDIQDMFIRDGVLTATGKRMCRLLKGENEKPKQPSPEPKRRTRNSAEKFDTKVDSEKLKVMSNVRVLLPKIPVDKLVEVEDDSQRYSLRRSNKATKSYTEIDSDDEKTREKEEKEREKAREVEREKEKAKEREKEKEKKIEEESEPKEKDEKQLTPPKKVKKRMKSWASGVLPKRKKKSVEEREESETDKSLDLVEPDKNYFSPRAWHTKTPCKLCDYDGMNITKHYRVKHPDSEVLSSRLSPDRAEEAIKNSLELKLDEKDDDAVLSTRRYRFVCRFCDFEMNAQTSNFYDHLSTHTGEYRHLCTICDFISSNNKQLRLHYAKEHGKDTYKKPAWVRTRLYGYICLECNFVQMAKKSVEDHVNVYHLGEGKKIMKVHLSSVDDEVARGKMKQQGEKKKQDVPVVSREEPKEKEVEKESKVVEDPKPKRRKIVEKKKIKEEVLSPKPVKKEKEIDMTVFTCNTDLAEENEKIEQERLQKMTELNESVKTNRQSLNFVDQLSNRLLQEQKEQSEATPEVVTVKSEPVDPEPEPEPEPIVETAPKKQSKIIEPVPAMPVVQKDNTIIQGMIQKLQGILKEEKTTIDGPPPLAPLLEKPLDEQKTFLNAGFLNISKLPEGLEYACRVPSCLFTTTNRNGFVVHWNEDHTRINQSFKMTKCRICQEEITATPNGTLLSNFFAHVENVHLCGITTSFNAGLISVDKDREGSDEYCCRVRLCGFTTKVRDEFVAHFSDYHPGLKDMPKTTKCGICQTSITATPDLSLLRNLFTHLETQHLQEVDLVARKVLRTRRLSGDKLSLSKEEASESPEDENPFPFKISGVMSLAEESVPPLSPIRDVQIQKTTKIESVILKEAKMNNMEKAAAWKSAEAFKKFLSCPRELYKCPQFFCKYCTSFRHLFETHIKAHARVNDELVSCVYCDIKTPLSHAGLHIDLRHSNCLYACSQCMYRALTREYVVIHNKLRHKETDQIVSLPPKTAKTIMMSKQKKLTVKEVCPAYRCGHPNCGAEFLYLNEFWVHVRTRHEGEMVCGGGKCEFRCMLYDNVVEHWQGHGCHNYQCLLCKVGCVDVYAMLEHYSAVHPNMEPSVVDRRSAPANPDIRIYGYSEEAFAHIKYMNEEILDSLSTQQWYNVSEAKSDPKPAPEPPKNVTLVPLSLIQPIDKKKIIAIIPNQVDAAIFTGVAKETTPAPSSPSFVFASISDDKDKEEGPKDDAARIADGDGGADPLSLDGEVGGGVVADDEGDCQELNECGFTKNYGLLGYQLFRCAFCDISFSNPKDFKTHCMHSKQCRETKNAVRQFKCVHCTRLFKNPHGLLEHIQYHGQLRFGCSLCVKKFPSQFSLKLHMRSKHNVTNYITTPVVPNKTNIDRDEFVLRPVPVVEPEIGKEGATVPKFTGQKAVYGPEEIDDLPKRYIFNSDVKCALCSYSTKVRTNLVRHLQFHATEKSVPDIAPVNPVPCLDKNERMFDKMTNLAISSFAASSSGRMGGVKAEPKSVKEENTQVPAYVPSHRRYVCCADGCNYLCLEESYLRHHLHTLHVHEPSFTCAHCKKTLKTDVDGFLKHLKLHDLHLYKCSGCSFVHNLRHKVDKHAGDKHPDKPTHTITIRALETEIVDADQSQSGGNSAGVISEAPPAPNIKWTKPWHCGMCKYRCAAKTDIVAHIFNKHDINTQYKCTLCSYKTDEKNTFEGHFKENHPDSDIDIIYVYYKSEGSVSGSTNQKQFDTTPLWQRDRPRVRHIRGILFEETSPQKNAKKGVSGRGSVAPSTAPSTSTASNLDLAIDAVAKGTDDVSRTDTTKETVIIIDDEEEDLDGEVDRLNDSGENVLFIDVDAKEAGPSEIKEEPDKGLLSEEMLINKYGKLCLPVAKAFKCPFCLKFKTRKVSFFVYHLLVEMKCCRFKCNLCDFSSVAFDAMLPHCQMKHDSVIAANVTDTPLDNTVEYWLQLLLKYQSKALIQQTPPCVGDEEPTAATKHQCEYCHKWFKSVHHLKEHELYHWGTHTYTCGHCLSDHSTLDELFQHTFMTHPAFEVSLKTNGPYVSKVLSTLKSPPPTAAAAALPGGLVNEVWVTEYACAYCPEAESSLEALHRHVNDCHEGEEFTYKAVTKSKVEVMYCCTYCHERGPEKLLRQHHAEKHEGSKFNMYQFICLECSATFLNIKDLRAHFSKSHSGKKLTYSCVENKLGGAKDQYCCLKCPFRSCSLGGIRAHLRKHLRPIDCLLCNATFIYPTEARAHHNKEHIHSPEKVEENKDRLKEYEEMIQQIVANREKGGSPPARKMLARKSTGAPFVREHKKEADLNVEVNRVAKKTSNSNTLNIFPVVEVNDDCESREEES